MRETIHRVMAAEDEANRLIEAARVEADALRAESRRRAQELVENGQREARLAAAALIDAAVREAEAEREDRIRTARAELEASIRLDETVARKAVDAIVAYVSGGTP